MKTSNWKAATFGAAAGALGILALLGVLGLASERYAALGSRHQHGSGGGATHGDEGHLH